MKRNNNVHKNDNIPSEMKHELYNASPEQTDKLHTHRKETQSKVVLSLYKNILYVYLFSIRLIRFIKYK
jgi:hypothetical protein